MVTYFNRKDLVAFGNYLLSEERKEMLIIEAAEKNVTHADVENFLHKQENKPRDYVIINNSKIAQTLDRQTIKGNTF